MATAALADVLVRDAQPPVTGGRGDHPLQEASVSLLDVGAPAELGPGVAQPHHERVAHPLQIADREHARPAGGADAPGEAGTGKGRLEQLAELALELRDLAPKVVAGGPLLRRSERLQAQRTGGMDLRERLGH